MPAVLFGVEVNHQEFHLLDLPTLDEPSQHVDLSALDIDLHPYTVAKHDVVTKPLARVEKVANFSPPMIGGDRVNAGVQSAGIMNRHLGIAAPQAGPHNFYPVVAHGVKRREASSGGLERPYLVKVPLRLHRHRKAFPQVRTNI